ncbi:MAG: cobalamin-binding protein [Alphaproteobacteria bacterium]
MKASPIRVVSLIPSATEIVASLGLAERLVGRSHECDWPAEVSHLPALTQPRFTTDRSNAEIHRSVTALLKAALGVYDLDVAELERLKPTHIVTQTQCDVCSVRLEEVEDAVASLSGRRAEIVALAPMRLADLFDDIRRVARALGAEAEPVVSALEARLARLSAMTAAGPKPRVACIEWLEPLMAAGTWVPELVEIAGGRCLFAEAGERAPWLEWDTLRNADPDVIVFMPCGFDSARTEAELLNAGARWRGLRAGQEGEVYAVDANRYFSRPGPRLIESAEVLAEILRPDLSGFGHEGDGWRRIPL